MSLPIDRQPFSAHWVAAGQDSVQVARPAWLKWCYSVVDRAFGFDLHEEEVRQLMNPERRE